MIPKFGEPVEGQIEIPLDTKFSIDTGNQTIHMQEKGTSINVGTQLSYITVGTV